MELRHLPEELIAQVIISLCLSYCNVNNCLLTGNTASQAGGGAYFATLNNCTLTGNAATSTGGTTGDGGGGAYYSTLNNCLLSGNTVAIGSEGGGAYFGTLNNCTITGNSASYGSGGASHCSLRNCIVFGNAGNYVGGVLNYCCTTPLPNNGTGNFTDAPLFVNAAGGNFNLRANSPCVNAGINGPVGGTTDLAGQPRIVAGTVDVGAYEYQGPYKLSAATDGGGTVSVGPPIGNDFMDLVRVVTATPAPGWTLLQWLGDATGTNPVVSVNLTRNKTVRAMFGTSLNTAVVGGGSLVTNPMSLWYPYGTPLQISAIPNIGNTFAYWTGDASGQTNSPLIFPVVNANPTITAVFASLGASGTNALTVVPDGFGFVTFAPTGNCFPVNANVLVQAAPDTGQDFLGWSGDASGRQNPLTVTMDSSKIITANFTRRPSLSGEGNPAMLNQDGFRLTVTGEFGSNYEIFGTTNFSAWTLLGNVSNAWGMVQFIDAPATNLASRFYRALLLP